MWYILHKSVPFLYTYFFTTWFCLSISWSLTKWHFWSFLLHNSFCACHLVATFLHSDSSIFDRITIRFEVKINYLHMPIMENWKQHHILQGNVILKLIFEPVPGMTSFPKSVLQAVGGSGLDLLYLFGHLFWSTADSTYVLSKLLKVKPYPFFFKLPNIDTIKMKRRL